MWSLVVRALATSPGRAGCSLGAEFAVSEVWVEQGTSLMSETLQLRAGLCFPLWRRRRSRNLESGSPARFSVKWMPPFWAKLFQYPNKKAKQTSLKQTKKPTPKQKKKTLCNGQETKGCWLREHCWVASWVDLSVPEPFSVLWMKNKELHLVFFDASSFN